MNPTYDSVFNLENIIVETSLFKDLVYYRNKCLMVIKTIWRFSGVQLFNEDQRVGLKSEFLELTFEHC